MMMEALFNGKIIPAESVIPVERIDYMDETRTAGELTEKLEKRLSAEDFATLEKLKARLQNAACIENETYFKYGFSLGMKLAHEAHECLTKYAPD